MIGGGGARTDTGRTRTPGVLTRLLHFRVRALGLARSAGQPDRLVDEEARAVPDSVIAESSTQKAG